MGPMTDTLEERLPLPGDQRVDDSLKPLHGLIVAEDATSQGLAVDGCM